jgi:hypothetical protein
MITRADAKIALAIIRNADVLLETRKLAEGVIHCYFARLLQGAILADRAQSIANGGPR